MGDERCRLAAMPFHYRVSKLLVKRQHILEIAQQVSRFYFISQIITFKYVRFESETMEQKLRIENLSL